MPPSHRGHHSIAFLLSLGSLPIACGEDHDADTLVGGTNPPTAGEQGDDGDDGDDGGDADDGDGATTTTGAEPTTATSGPATEPTTTEPGTATTPPTTDDSGTTDPATSTTGVDSDASQGFITTQEDSGETSDPGDTGETSDPPPATDPICIAYGEQIGECFRYDAGTVAAYCQQYKELGLQEDGQACPDAFDAYYVCLSKLGCAELMEGACPDESAAIDAACPNLLGP